MAILLKNATYLDWRTLEIKQKNILVAPFVPSIRFIEDDEPLASNRDIEELDCTGMLVTKSFAVGHHHAYSALSRGMGAPAVQPQNFYDILKYIWWTLDKCLDREMIEASALVTAMACAKAGSTFVIDHHASPFALRGSLEIIARAFEKVGVSHLLCYEVSDRDGMEIANLGLEETEEHLKNHPGLVGLHASFTVSEETLKKAVDIMNRHNSGIHIHVAEDAWDQEHCMKNYNKRVIERLNDAGALSSSKTLLVHCLHLNDYERNIIKNSPAWVVQNTESNLNNNVGYFSAAGLGQKILLGTDGMHSDMLQSAKSAYLTGQRQEGISPAETYRRLRNVHNYTGNNGIPSDGENNLVILDYNTPTPLTQSNFYGHFLYGINSGHVRDVIANGRLIVKDRRLTRVDETEILEASKKLALRLWKKMAETGA